MYFSEYAKQAMTTAVYPEEKVSYPIFGLIGEVGEIFEKIKKEVLRGDKELDKEQLALEVGDLLWYTAVVSNTFGNIVEKIDKPLEAFQYADVNIIELDNLESLQHSDDIVKDFEERITTTALMISTTCGKISEKYFLTKTVDEDDIDLILCLASKLCEILGYDINWAAEKNLEKLASRKKRNVLKGSGDNR